jgi:hypothetical protein
MKTYILRQPKTVESQKPARQSRRKTATGTTATVVLGRPLALTNDRVLFTGFDVHTDSIAVSLAPSDSTEVRRYGIIGGIHDDVLKLLTKLHAAHPGTELRCCYEAGPHGLPRNRTSAACSTDAKKAFASRWTMVRDMVHSFARRMSALRTP